MYIQYARNMLKVNSCLQLSDANILFHLADDALSSELNYRTSKRKTFFVWPFTLASLFPPVTLLVHQLSRIHFARTN